MGPEGEEGVGAMAVWALGVGFDLTSNFLLKFAKGYPDGARLVELRGEVIRDVPTDVRCHKGERTRFQSDLLEFNKVSGELVVGATAMESLQVTTGKKPLTGLRLYLEGKKCNRLAIHVQHLSSTPSMLELAICMGSSVCGEAMKIQIHMFAW